MPILTGGQIIVDRLIAEGVPIMAGIPGHGIIAAMDAARLRASEISIIQVRHEQSAVHLADGYYRVAGKPIAVFTSIGPGALNTAVGLGSAYVDSIPVLVMSGEAHTYMAGRGVLQEIERQRPADLPTAMEPLTKKVYRPKSPTEVYDAMQDAFRVMREGRPGPVFISLPMDVQAEAADVPEARSVYTIAPRHATADAAAVSAAAELLRTAKRPVIVAGGGVTLSNAEPELRALAEQLGAAVVTTLQGKGCFPEDHPLYGWHLGTKGTSVGNALTTTADVILAVGTRVTDQVASSYRRGATFNIPPTRLVQIDLDPAEIGKNLPVEIGIHADAATALRAIGSALASAGHRAEYESSAYFNEIASLRAAWLKETAPLRESDASPSTVPRFFSELRAVLDRDAVVVTSSGHAQACVLEFPFYEPRTNLTAGGFSTMGWSYPAALGAKLAAPARQVVAVVGDGDFLMTMQEMATAMQYGIAAVVVVLNNHGWYSIRDLQKAEFGEDLDFAVEFDDSTTPDFTAVAKAFGLRAERVDAPDAIGPAVRRALDAGGPALVEVMVARNYPDSGSTVAGWWDVPIPEYLEDRRAAYEKARAEEEPPPARR